MKKICFILMLLMLIVGCKHNNHKPDPRPTPAPSYNGLTVRNNELIYKNTPIWLNGYSSYGAWADNKTFQNVSTYNDKLVELASYKVNFTRNFMLSYAPFNAYNFVSGSDFVLTKERALEVKSWNKYAHTASWVDQWNPNYFDRLRAVVQKHYELNMIFGATFFDHWGMYKGHTTTNGYADGGIWVGYDSPKSLSFWDWCPYNPGNCWDGEQPVPIGEFTADYRKWNYTYANGRKSPPPADKLIFNNGAFYKDEAMRRKIFGEFIDKVVDTLKDYPNVMYEIGNEMEDYGNPETLHNFEDFVVQRILAKNPKAIITISTTLNSAYHRNGINFVMTHGLYNANCNANNIQLWNDWAGRPMMMDADGCHAGAQPGGNRSSPEFQKAFMDKCKLFKYHTNNKQPMDNLNYPLLNVIKANS